MHADPWRWPWQGHLEAVRVLAELGVALMPKDAGGQTPLQLAEKHQLEFGDGSVAKFVFRQLNPAVTDKQIARRWRAKVRPTPRLCQWDRCAHAAIAQVIFAWVSSWWWECAQTEGKVMACHRAKAIAKAIADEKRRWERKSGSAFSQAMDQQKKVEAAAKAKGVLPVLEVALPAGSAGGDITLGDGAGLLRLRQRRTGVTMAQFAAHQVDALAFDAVAEAAEADARASATAAAMSPSSMGSNASPSPTGRRRGALLAVGGSSPTSGAGSLVSHSSAMFRAAAQHERKSIKAKAKAERVDVFSRLASHAVDKGRVGS
jgi:hypothetical protein